MTEHPLITKLDSALARLRLATPKRHWLREVLTEARDYVANLQSARQRGGRAAKTSGRPQSETPPLAKRLLREVQNEVLTLAEARTILRNSLPVGPDGTGCKFSLPLLRKWLRDLTPPTP